MGFRRTVRDLFRTSGDQHARQATHVETQPTQPEPPAWWFESWWEGIFDPEIPAQRDKIERIQRLIDDEDESWFVDVFQVQITPAKKGRVWVWTNAVFNEFPSESDIREVVASAYGPGKYRVVAATSGAPIHTYKIKDVPPPPPPVPQKLQEKSVVSEIRERISETTLSPCRTRSENGP